MATRDLTYRFKQARSVAIRDAPPGAAGAAFDSGMLVAAVPEYVDEVDRINETIRELQTSSESAANNSPVPRRRPRTAPAAFLVIQTSVFE
jgi:hypothetical protein